MFLLESLFAEAIVLVASASLEVLMVQFNVNWLDNLVKVMAVTEAMVMAEVIAMAMVVVLMVAHFSAN